MDDYNAAYVVKGSKVPVSVVAALTWNQRVALAILAARVVCQEPGFVAWSDNWLVDAQEGTGGRDPRWAVQELCSLEEMKRAEPAFYSARHAAFAAAESNARFLNRYTANAVGWARDASHGHLDLASLVKRAVEVASD